MAEDPSLSTENELARANSAPLLSARRLCKRFRNGGAVVNVASLGSYAAGNTPSVVSITTPPNATPID